jgi:hypothetical protein
MGQALTNHEAQRIVQAMYSNIEPPRSDVKGLYNKIVGHTCDTCQIHHQALEVGRSVGAQETLGSPAGVDEFEGREQQLGAAVRVG